jgi:TonB family protein
VFPSSFTSFDVKGSATVEFVVTEDGTPQGLQVVKSTHPKFTDSVVTAVRGFFRDRLKMRTFPPTPAYSDALPPGTTVEYDYTTKWYTIPID